MSNRWHVINNSLFFKKNSTMNTKKKYIAPSIEVNEVKTSNAFLGIVGSAGGEIDNGGSTTPEDGMNSVSQPLNVF